MCLVKIRKIEDEDDDLRVRVRRHSHHSQSYPTIPPPAVIPIPAPQPRPLFIEPEPRRPPRIERDVQIVNISPSSSDGSVEIVHHPSRHRSRSRRPDSEEDVIFEERREVRYERERSPERLETYRYVNAPRERSKSRRRSVSRHSRHERRGDRDEYEDDVRVKVKRSYRD